MRTTLFAASDALVMADIGILGHRLLADSEQLAIVYVVVLALVLALRAAAEMCGGKTG